MNSILVNKGKLDNIIIMEKKVSAIKNTYEDINFNEV